MISGQPGAAVDESMVAVNKSGCIWLDRRHGQDVDDATMISHAGIGFCTRAYSNSTGIAAAASRAKMLSAFMGISGGAGTIA